MFGNSFDSSGSNMLSRIFQGAPNGTTVATWDPITLQYRTPSVFNGTSWSIDYDLFPGIGALLHTTSQFTNVFAGTLLQGPGPNEFNPPIPPVRPPGLLLIGNDFAGGSRTFQSLIGRAPRDGEYVTSLDELTQTYSTTHFLNSVWDNGDPILNLGDAAFYNLVPIPEPGSLSLLGMGVVAFGLRSWRKRA